MTTAINRAELLELLLPVARAAGQAIMDIYATDFAVRGKSDASPVTEADEKAEAVILPHLARLTPDILVVSEEEASAGRIPNVAGRFWLVDPLDGTKEFINRNGEFTVNIALIDNYRPVLGVVLAPALGRLFAGASGVGAFQEDSAGRRLLVCREVPAAGLTVVGSRSHRDGAELEAFLGGKTVADRLSVGSSLKFCLLAAGEADFYPRFGPTMEWDTAAGHGVLLAAGGRMRMLDGAEFVYGKPGWTNPGFIAEGRP